MVSPEIKSIEQASDIEKKVVDLIEPAEDLLIKRFGLAEPEWCTSFLFYDFTDTTTATYSPKRTMDRRRIWDTYYFDNSLPNQPWRQNLVTHEVAHRLYWWTLTRGSGLPFKETVDHLLSSIDRIANKDPGQVKLLLLLEGIIEDAFASYIEMLVHGRAETIRYKKNFSEAKVSNFKRKLKRVYIPGDERWFGALCNYLLGMEINGFTESGFSSHLGIYMAAYIYDEVGHDPKTADKLVRLFTDYDITKVTEQGYDPRRKYRDIFFEIRRMEGTGRQV